MNSYKETVGYMMRILRMHRCRIEQFVTELNVHHSQHRVLLYLKNHTAQSQKELAQAFHISPAAMAVTLKKLENGGFIHRNVQKADLRQNNIQITKKGVDVIKLSGEFFESLDSKMFEGITDDELSTFKLCLEKMEKNLKGENNEKMD